MYVYPNMELRILNGVNLNSDYDHTIYFANSGAQSVYFIGKTKYRLTNQMYQRKERGWIQVNLNQNDLWDCTYLMYKNTSYSGKWFYAFILSTDYINDSVSRINFEIDVMQTWMFDYQLEPCFVEREHTLTDNLYEHTVEEKITVGNDYICTDAQFIDLSPTKICIVATSDPTNNAATCKTYYHAVSGLGYYVYNALRTNPDVPTGAEVALSAYLENGYEDNIVSIFQYPGFMDDPLDNIPDINHSSGYKSEIINLNIRENTIPSYGTPKNNKLFSYPYHYIEVNDMQGNNVIWKCELFNKTYTNNCQALLEGCIIGKPVISICPRDYGGSAITSENRNESLVYDSLPAIAWSGDSYQIWLAQNSGKINADLISSIIGGVIQVGAGAAMVATGASRVGGAVNMVTGMTGLINSVMNNLAAEKDAQHMPNKVHGSPATSWLQAQSGTLGFQIRNMFPRPEFVSIIDNYFSKFGYACKQIKIPNTNARQNWTYTKTIGCEITGNVPSDDTVKIKSVYNNGITFWNNGNNIGNYGDFTNPVYSS